MKLLYTKRSPYARKVRVIALEKQVPLEFIDEDLANKSTLLNSSNPLGKVPTLILDNGEILFDSPVITQYIDGLNDKVIFIPRQGAERFKVLRWEAIADGLMDAAIGCYMEKMRHAQNFHVNFVKNQEEVILNTCRFCEEHLAELQPLSLAPVAVASAIGYVNFRLPHMITREEFPKLLAWFETFSQRPSMAQTIPVA